MPTNVQIVEARFSRAEKFWWFIKCTVCWLLHRTRVLGHNAEKKELETPCLGLSDGADILPTGVSRLGPTAPAESGEVVACYRGFGGRGQGFCILRTWKGEGSSSFLGGRPTESRRSSEWDQGSGGQALSPGFTTVSLLALAQSSTLSQSLRCLTCNTDTWFLSCLHHTSAVGLKELCVEAPLKPESATES